MAYAFDSEFADAVPALPSLDLADVPRARRELRERMAQLPPPDETGVTVRDLTIDADDHGAEIRLRIFIPQRARGPLPAIYDIHPGGLCVGSPDDTHRRCVELAREVNAVVASVDYRLAPEHPFPTPLEDCYAGLVWLVAHADELGVDPARVALRGVSAGGNLAAAVALLSRDRRGPVIRFQFLSVPELDDRLHTQSMRQFTDTPLLNRPQVALSWNHYLGPDVAGSAAVSPYAAPARADDLSGLPPTYINVMEFDPLRDEGIEYATRLLAAGVTVELHLFPGTFHASQLFADAHVSQRELAEELAVFQRALLDPPNR